MKLMQNALSKLRLVHLVTLALLTGCVSTASDRNREPPPPKPIEKVYAGMQETRKQYLATMAAGQAVIKDSITSVQQRRDTLSTALRGTEEAVQTLRADAQELRQRATEYLAIWSDQKLTSSGGDVRGSANQQRATTKKTYDEMVAYLLQARDLLLPALADYQSVEKRLKASTDDIQSLVPAIQTADSKSARGLAALDAAIIRITELMKMGAATQPAQQ